jgi:hypothetical protein
MNDSQKDYTYFKKPFSKPMISMKKITEIQIELVKTNSEFLSEAEQKLLKGGICTDDKRRERPGTATQKYFLFLGG